MSNKVLKSKLCLLEDVIKSSLHIASKTEAHEALHDEIIKSLLLIKEVNDELESKKNYAFDETRAEVEKISRKLKLWAKRPNQFNAKILESFLQLQCNGHQVITVELLRNEFNNNRAFDTNFPQMKIISDKNHGKLFEVFGEIVTLWPPAKDLIYEYDTKLKQYNLLSQISPSN